MENILPELFSEYERERKKLPEDSSIPASYINYTDVMKAYYLLADYFLTTQTEDEFLVGLKSPNLLASALSRQYISFGQTMKWNDPFSIGATLYYGLVKNHAFHDGNKRVALLTLLYHLWCKNRIADCNKSEFEQLTVRTAANELYKYGKLYKRFQKKDDTEILFLADFIKRKTRKIDRNYYPITYQEFNSKLKQYDCWLDHPSGGHIDVFKNIEKSIFLGVGKKTVAQRIFRIGFNGWNKQVRLRAVRETLKKAELTAEKGIDSQVFYRGGEPLSYLIGEFEGPLMRLKDK